MPLRSANTAKMRLSQLIMSLPNAVPLADDLVSSLSYEIGAQVEAGDMSRLIDLARR